MQADLSDLSAVEAMASEILDAAYSLDVLINNAGVYRTPTPVTDAGLDSRFVVNTVAPYLLTRRLLPALAPGARVLNLSSAAQAPVDLDALGGSVRIADMDAYAQSKLAITMWSRHLADELGDSGPVVLAINPGSLLATNMVREGFGYSGNDINIGVDILVRAATSDDFADVTGRYFDDDICSSGDPHEDALDAAKNAAVVEQIEALLTR
ncbi:SDR family NAD(P)-dependent oxidoreductase [Ornithinimicrobium sp. INDO-MA30-4]|nr:SDR family NAD(P)-dependent oxidoreductase [Ornithinimicrobium sp. INDO-MA30-4]